jgi:hypothetical protein
MAMFGMLTGTASTGIALLRGIDPDLETDVAKNLVLGSAVAARGAGGGADAPIETQYPRNAVRKGDAAILALRNTVIPGSGRWPQ